MGALDFWAEGITQIHLLLGTLGGPLTSNFFVSRVLPTWQHAIFLGWLQRKPKESHQLVGASPCLAARTFQLPGGLTGELKGEAVFNDIAEEHRKSMFESLVVKAKEAEEDAEKAPCKSIWQ